MVIIGNSSVSGKITTNGQQDLLLSTYSNSSTSSKINIKNEFLRIGRLAPQPKAIMDTLELVRRLKMPRPHNLGSLCQRHGIRLEAAHTAAAGDFLLWTSREVGEKMGNSLTRAEHGGGRVAST